MSAPDSPRWLNHPVIVNYGVPVLSVGAMVIVGRLLDLYLHAAPVSLFICAVMFSAWLGGFTPGLLATVLSILAFKYYFAPPIFSLALETAETSGKPAFDPDGRFLGYRGVSTDVTASVGAEQVEKALQQAQAELARVVRATTLGELAASIAHEINQPLAAIGADAHACLHWLAADRPDLDSVREALTAIVKDSHRAGEVITRIRTLLVRSPVAHEPCDLTGVIREMLTLVAPEIMRHGIALETSLAPGLPQVMGDPIQLQQVLLNLLLNAAAAMREVPAERRRLLVRSSFEQREDGLWAVVAVEDGGGGFGEAGAAHLFDAFYTTKPGGLGMELSISRSIIDTHRGRLWATANPAHGATFHLALPGMR